MTKRTMILFRAIACASLLVTLTAGAFAQDSECPPPEGDHRTQTQGGWGGDACQGSNPRCILNANFPTVFPAPNYLTIGGGFTMQFTSAAAVAAFLPNGSTPDVLTASVVDPTTSPAGVFAAQMTALAINIAFGDHAVVATPPFTDIGGLYIQSGFFAGMTVDEFFALANTVLGGDTDALPSGADVSDASDAAAAINEGFVDGETTTDYLCPDPPCPVPAPIQIAVGDHFCLEFCGQPIKVYWRCPFEGQPVFSTVPGCYLDQEGCMTECTPYTGEVDVVAQWDSSNSDSPAPGGWWSAVFTAQDNGCVCVTFDRQLAVELVAFDAIAGDHAVTVQWATASENHSDYFDVLRDGVVVHRQQAVGNSASRTDYEWMDASAAAIGQTYTYTLEAVDLAGTRHRLGTTLVTLSGGEAVAREFALFQNYPNPFNPVTTIGFALAESAPVRLVVFDLTGREVAVLASGDRSAGYHSVSFDGSRLGAGVYFYRLQAGSFTAVRKLMLMK